MAIAPPGAATSDRAVSFLVFDGVTRRFGPGLARPALDSVSFSVARASTALITGPSGSGKTTLLHLAAGLDRPDAGRVMADGTNVGELPEGARARWRAGIAGMIFQQHELPRGWRVLDAAASPLLWSRGAGPAQAREQAFQLLERLGMAAFAESRIEHLSGGQRQRVAIARALIGRPKLVLADEPTAQLDEDTSVQITEMLREAARELGAAMLVVSHEHSVEEWGAQAHFVLREGRLSPA